MIETKPIQWAQWAECDECHAQTPIFAVTSNDVTEDTVFNYMRNHGWKRYFPPGSKTHADERVMCGECRQADLADAKDGVPNV
jgi:hypothetical protein